MSTPPHPAAGPLWLKQKERGSPWLIRFMAALARVVGRPISRLILHPICLYFTLTHTPPRRASAQFLARAGHPAHALAVYQHIYRFCTVILDRVYFLCGQQQRFEFHIFGDDALKRLIAEKRGAIFLGAHMGSFEAARAIGQQIGGLRVALAMYEANAQKLKSTLAALNPAAMEDIIALGQPGSILRVRDHVMGGGVVGMLADRNFNEEIGSRTDFLGASASLPEGPFKLASLLPVDVFFMVALYRGGRRYDVHFEPLEKGDDLRAAYVKALEKHARAEPTNWFNFFDFWAPNP